MLCLALYWCFLVYIIDYMIRIFQYMTNIFHYVLCTFHYIVQTSHYVVRTLSYLMRISWDAHFYCTYNSFCGFLLIFSPNFLFRDSIIGFGLFMIWFFIFRYTQFLFFSVWVFFHEHSQFRIAGEGRDHILNTSLPLPPYLQALGYLAGRLPQRAAVCA